MKIVLAESGRAVGGTERVVWEIATRLPAARWEVEVWLSPDPGVDPLAEALAARAIAVRRVAEVDSRTDLTGMARTWWTLRRARADLLHLHHVWPAADRYLAAIAAAAGVPHLVVTEHIVGRPHSPAQAALKRRELEMADAVTAVAHAVAESLVEDYGVERERVRVVPNGADVPDDEEEREPARRWRERLGAGMLRPLWVCVARLEEQKGHDVLLDAAAEVRRRGLEFVLALAGEGSKRAELEQRAQALGIADRVRFLGHVDDAATLLAAANVVVLPSRWEGLPLVVLEAMMRGRPIVASAVGGVPEVLSDGVNGRLVPPGDVQALASALEQFHRKFDHAQQLGRRARAEARERYAWPSVVAAFETVYDEVLGLASFAPEGATPGGAR